MNLELRNGEVTFDENQVTVTLDLRQSKKFYGEAFETESIDADLFVRSIEQEAPVIFNHRREQIVSDDYDVKAENGIVTINVRLDERNMYASTILSLREKSKKRLGCSFGFRCLKDEIRNKHREIKELIVSEISILSCESAYPSSVRCLENDEIREISIEELKQMIDESVAKALEPKQEVIVEQVKVDNPVEKEEPKVAELNPTSVNVKLDASDFKEMFDTFLHDVKEAFPKQVEPVQVQVKEEVKPQIDDENVIDADAKNKLLEKLNF